MKKIITTFIIAIVLVSSFVANTAFAKAKKKHHVSGKDTMFYKYCDSRSSTSDPSTYFCFYKSTAWSKKWTAAKYQKGIDIARLSVFLTEKGFYSGPKTKTFTKELEESLAKFQKENEIDVAPIWGTLNRKTRFAINKMLESELGGDQESGSDEESGGNALTDEESGNLTDEDGSSLSDEVSNPIISQTQSNVIMNPVSDIGAFGAKLSGSFTSQSNDKDAWFQFGKSDQFVGTGTYMSDPKQSAQSGTISFNAGNLESNTVYYARLIVQKNDGTNRVSPTVSFTTLQLRGGGGGGGGSSYVAPVIQQPEIGSIIAEGNFVTSANHRYTSLGADAIDMKQLNGTISYKLLSGPISSLINSYPIITTQNITSTTTRNFAFFNPANILTSTSVSLLPVGTYTYEVSVNNGVQSQLKTGTFTVKSYADIASITPSTVNPFTSALVNFNYTLTANAIQSFFAYTQTGTSSWNLVTNPIPFFNSQSAYTGSNTGTITVGSLSPATDYTMVICGTQQDPSVIGNQCSDPNIFSTNGPRIYVSESPAVGVSTANGGITFSLDSWKDLNAGSLNNVQPQYEFPLGTWNNFGSPVAVGTWNAGSGTSGGSSVFNMHYTTIPAGLSPVTQYNWRVCLPGYTPTVCDYGNFTTQ
jgi:hypothetical protein